MTQRKQLPIKTIGSNTKEIQVNDVLVHPMEQGVGVNERARWKYRFLRVTRYPTADRPESGRLLVENQATGKRTEHYALLFNVRFQG